VSSLFDQSYFVSVFPLTLFYIKHLYLLQKWDAPVDDAIAEFNQLTKKQAKNFQNYLRKHRSRIPDYQLYQELSICIGSGSVESWIKQIGSRIKIIGAQWNRNNVSQILKLRCAYLNSKISLGISA
jgi:hypothetical protein